MPRDEKTFEMESQGSAAKSALQPAGLDSALPEFRNARLDGSGGGADGGRVNLGAHFVDWCTRHDVLPRKVVDGELRPLEGPDFTRIIEANASMSPAGDPIPEHGSAAVQLGLEVGDRADGLLPPARLHGLAGVQVRPVVRGARPGPAGQGHAELAAVAAEVGTDAAHDHGQRPDLLRSGREEGGRGARERDSLSRSPAGPRLRAVRGGGRAPVLGCALDEPGKGLAHGPHRPEPHVRGRASPDLRSPVEGQRARGREQETPAADGESPHGRA